MFSFEFFLFIHILCGTIGLVAGSVTMAITKGNKRHKLIGRIFAVSMLGAGFSSLILASLHRNDFLALVGVFTIYMTGTGWRYVSYKKLKSQQKAYFIDWALVIFMLLSSFFFLWLGAKYLYQKNYFGLVILLFFLRGITFVWQDIRFFSNEGNRPNDWLINHLQRMSGAYIASLTAFAVVNAPHLFSVISWILPSAIVVPFIVKWTRKYKKLMH